MDYSGKIITKNAVEPSQTSASGVWTLDQAAQAVESNTWPIANVPNPISRSLRFNSADTAYLNRTFGTPTSNTTWTLSLWLKRSLLGNGSTSFGIFGESTGYAGVYFSTGDNIRMFDNAGSQASITTAVFRDPSAYGHLVIRSNGTNIKTYWNNLEVASYTGTISLLNASGGTMQLGKYSGTYFNGYMAQVQFIDGQALDATYFGMTDPRTGAWISKPYTGTYGNNGFYLNFSDNSSTAALGTDYSGNNNTWTTNNFSVTAGSGNDSLVDVPTNWVAYNTGDVGGVIRGNYATRNPLAASSSSTGYTTNGNLDAVWSSGGSFENAATIGFDSTDLSGYYWEYLVNGTALSRYPLVGIANSDAIVAFTGKSGGSAQPGTTSGGWMFENASGNKLNNNTTTSYGTTTTSGWGCVAVKNGKIFIGSISGGVITWKNSGNPITEANPMFSGITGIVFPTTSEYSSATISYNFGQQAFQATPPAGFKSLCTTNLPEPTILDGGDYFNAVLYTGNGTSQSITGVGFQPDFIIAKTRSISSGTSVVDSARGLTKLLGTASSAGEATQSAGQGFTAFNSDGFSLGTDASIGSTNYNGATYVAWNWKESATSGFDIVTYTGTGVVRTVNHNLGVAPSMIIVKARTAAESWPVYHTTISPTNTLYLNGTNAQFSGTGWWNNTAATSTVFTVGTSGNVNDNGVAYVAYLFAAVPGYSAFGSYVGNGSTDGPFIYLGFRPKYVMVKRIDSTGRWPEADAARSPYNVGSQMLYADASNAEDTGSGATYDFVSNGIKLRALDSNWNSSGGTYIYAAFAENPFKYSNAR